MGLHLILSEEDIVTAAVKIVIAVSDAIRALGSVPSGELHARLATQMGPHSVNYIVNCLKSEGLIEEVGGVIYWTGPCICHQGSVCTEACKHGAHHDGCSRRPS